MKFSSMFITGNQNYSTSGTREGIPAGAEQALKNGAAEVLAKTSGQTITGEVMQINGNEILLAIGKDQLINAKLDSSISLQLGQYLTFEIKNFNSSKILLSPLFENTAQNESVSQALKAAGLPLTDDMTEMVKTLMKEGMPIDKNALIQMSRLLTSHPTANTEILVQMSRLQLPVTEQTIYQFQAYKNYEHQISESLMEIADSLPETFKALLQDSKTTEAITLYKEVISFLSEGTMNASSSGGEGLTANQSTDTQTIISQTTDGRVTAGDSLLTQMENIQNKNLFFQEGNVNLSKEEGSLQSQITETVKSGTEVTGKLLLTPEELTKLAAEMKRMGFPEEFTQLVSQNKLSSSEFFMKLDLFLKESELPIEHEALSKMFEGKEFTQLLKSELGKQWLIQPQDVGLDKEVSKLYEKLNEQMNRLTKVLEQAAKGDTPMGRAVANVSGNIDFMNHLNQVFTYVQLPLKMHGKEAHGELYVYTNKKNLAKKDGKVSALLHLDMEHLGSIDVHVSLMDKNVSTQFYLADESTLDLIESHIYILDERLQKRGYYMKSEFIKKDKAENVMEEIIKQGRNIAGGQTSTFLAGYSFDVRA